MMRGARGVLVLVGLVACKRTPEATDAGVTAPPPAVTQPAEGPAAAPTFDPAAPAPRELPTAEGPRDPYLLQVGTETIPGAPASAAPPSDPFEPVIASVRSSAVGCFAGLPPGAYSATIAVSITPTGTASTVTVTSGPSDEAVRKCLVQAATRSYPASADGRKLSIDVAVKG